MKEVPSESVMSLGVNPPDHLKSTILCGSELLRGKQ